MRLFKTIIILFITSSCIFGQKTAISNLKFRTLYIDIENPLSIVVSNFPCEKLLIKVNNGTIKKTDSCQYLLRPINCGSVLIEVWGINGNDTSIIDTLNFQTKRIPDPIAYSDVKANILGFHCSSIKTIMAKVENLDVETYFKVLSFDVLRQRKGNVIDSIHYEGDKVDEKYIQLIEKCKKKDIVWFDNILVMGEDLRTRSIQPFCFKCKHCRETKF